MTERKAAKKGTTRKAAARGGASRRSTTAKPKGSAKTNEETSSKPKDDPKTRDTTTRRSPPASRSKAKPNTSGAPAKPVNSNKVQTFATGEEFKNHFMEKYGLADHMVWSARDNKTNRTSYILRQAAIELIAVQEGMTFSPPVYHEKPGIVLVYDRPVILDDLSHDRSVVCDVHLLQEKKSGTSPNFGRYSVEGKAQTPDRLKNKQPAVVAYASASDGGPGDGAGYSAFIATHNRLKARLVLAATGASMHSFYSDSESESFEPATDAGASATTKPNDPPPPESTSSPDFSQARTTRSKARKSSKPVKSDEEPLEDSGSSTSEQEEKPAAKRKASKPKGMQPEKTDKWFNQKTEVRITAYNKMAPDECYEWVLEEIERSKNSHHIGNLWPYLQGLIEKMEFPEDAVADLESAKSAKESAFTRANSITDPESDAPDREDSPEAIAESICEEYSEAEDLDELRNLFIGNQDKSMRIKKTKPDGEVLFAKMIAAKDARKVELDG